jgi:ribosomal protein S18 acetylase RimI-like enzyme
MKLCEDKELIHPHARESHLKNDIMIRLIRETDVPAFHEALDAVCRERKYLAGLEAPPLENVRKFIESNVKSGHPQFVAEADGRIVGWCDAIPGIASAGTAHVGHLGMGVLDEFRGQKIGQRLLEATIEMAQRIGIEKIELSVYSANAPAISLYRKMGFVEEGRKRQGRLVDGVYDDVLLMALNVKG